MEGQGSSLGPLAYQDRCLDTGLEACRGACREAALGAQAQGTEVAMGQGA